MLDSQHRIKAGLLIELCNSLRTQRAQGVCMGYVRLSPQEEQEEGRGGEVKEGETGRRRKRREMKEGERDQGEGEEGKARQGSLSRLNNFYFQSD